MCSCKAREGLPVKNGIRMSDIAKELGVSVVTVSNALNDRGGVSEEMRRRVKALASELGYRPSAPRTPRKTVSAVQEQGGSIGILTSQRFADVRGTFYWFLTAGVSKELTNCNLYSVYESVSEDRDRPSGARTDRCRSACGGLSGTADGGAYPDALLRFLRSAQRD